MCIFVANFKKILHSMPKISCFLPFADEKEGQLTIETLRADANVADIQLIETPFQTKSLRRMSEGVSTPYIFALYQMFRPSAGLSRPDAPRQRS